MEQAYFVRNARNPSGSVGQRDVAGTAAPAWPATALAPPRFPAAAQRSLASMRPVCFVARFSCEQRCRSFGICVHFQFCAGMRHCPDGLVCGRCLGTAPEMVRLLEGREEKKTNIIFCFWLG